MLILRDNMANSPFDPRAASLQLAIQPKPMAPAFPSSSHPNIPPTPAAAMDAINIAMQMAGTIGAEVEALERQALEQQKKRYMLKVNSTINVMHNALTYLTDPGTAS